MIGDCDARQRTSSYPRDAYKTSPSHANTRVPGNRPTHIKLRLQPSSSGGPSGAGVSGGMAMASAFRFQHKIRTNCQNIHFRPLEAVDRLFGLAHNRLVLVEAGVESHGNAGLALKSLNQIVVERILLAGHRLQSARIIHVV